MSNNKNLSHLTGRLTDRPTEGQTNSQRSFTRFNLAVSRNYKNKNGEYDVDFIPCKAYRNSADYLIKYGDRGDTVSLAGEIRQDRWTDQQGNNRSYVYVLVDDASIIAHPQRNQESRRHYESQQQSYQQGNQGYPQQQPQQAPQQPQGQPQQQELATGNGGWDQTGAGQKRLQTQQNDQPVEINDDALPFNQGGQNNDSNVTNEDDLPF